MDDAKSLQHCGTIVAKKLHTIVNTHKLNLTSKLSMNESNMMLQDFRSLTLVRH